MGEISMDGLLSELTRDTPPEEIRGAYLAMRIIAAALRNPTEAAEALDRAAARLEGASRG